MRDISINAMEYIRYCPSYPFKPVHRNYHRQVFSKSNQKGYE